MNISKIDALCRKNNISRTILEERAGISNGALGKWEKSPYGPSITKRTCPIYESHAME